MLEAVPHTITQPMLLLLALLLPLAASDWSPPLGHIEPRVRLDASGSGWASSHEGRYAQDLVACTPIY